MNAIDIGLEKQDRESVAQSLKQLLADSYSLYLQTHNFHWNVTGPHFVEFHSMFEQQYSELALAVDEIAERIRTLGYPAPGTYVQFAKLSNVKEVLGVPTAMEMISILKKNHEIVVRTCREVLRVAQHACDESTIALVSDRMRVHEKTSWMLRAIEN